MSNSLGSTEHYIESKIVFLKRLEEAIEAGDIDDFAELVSAGCVYFGATPVTGLLSFELPLMLGETLTERMHSFMEMCLAQ